MNNKSANLLVVEDEPLVRSLLVTILETENYQIRSAASAAEAREVMTGFVPDVALLDIELGNGPSGLDLAQVLRAKYPKIGLVFLSHIPELRVIGMDNKKLPKKAAFLRKDLMTDAGSLRKAVGLVLNARTPGNVREDKSFPNPFSHVSRSQLDVLRLVAMGLTNQEIATHRGTTVRAVENLCARAFLAIGVSKSGPGHGRVAAARKFIRVAGMPHAEYPYS